MSNPDEPIHPVWRRWWKPAVVTGAGGAAIAVWLDDILVFAEEILGILLLPIMAGIIYVLDILMFRSRMPRREEMEQPHAKRAKK
jgi:hypothetical protein